MSPRVNQDSHNQQFSIHHLGLSLFCQKEQYSHLTQLKLIFDQDLLPQLKLIFDQDLLAFTLHFINHSLTHLLKYALLQLYDDLNLQLRKNKSIQCILAIFLS